VCVCCVGGGGTKTLCNSIVASLFEGMPMGLLWATNRICNPFGPYVVTLPKQTPIFEQYMIRLVVKNGHVAMRRQWIMC